MEGPIPAERGTQPTPLETKVLRNFRLSFQFSQGRIPLQHLLIADTARRYSQVDFTNEFPTMEVLGDKLKSRVAQIGPPKKHKETKSDYGRSLADSSPIPPPVDEQWQCQRIIFNKVLYGVDEPQAPEREEEIDLAEYILGEQQTTDWVGKAPLRLKGDGLLAEIIRITGETDVHYLRKGRPGREPNDPSKFESFLKTYVIDQSPTTSVELDAMFAEARVLLFGILNGTVDLSGRKRISKMVHKLQKNWDKKHTGESFFPVDATIEASN